MWLIELISNERLELTIEMVSNGRPCPYDTVSIPERTRMEHPDTNHKLLPYSAWTENWYRTYDNHASGQERASYQYYDHFGHLLHL